jgi:hypothetical protein
VVPLHPVLYLIEKYLDDGIMNLDKVSFAQFANSVSLLGPNSILINHFLLFFATLLAYEFLASFAFMNALKFPCFLICTITLG